MKGKNKEQFDKWFEDNPLIYGNNFKVMLLEYERLPFEMQIGVYLAYYDSLRLRINVDFYGTSVSSTWSYIIWKYIEVYSSYDVEDSLSSKDYSSRNEAYKEAFKKADEIINK